MAKFALNIVGTIMMDGEDFWPEGEAPENPTVEDVLAMIQIAGGLRGVFLDWSLCDDVRLMVVKEDGSSGMEGDVNVYPEQYDEDPNMY